MADKSDDRAREAFFGTHAAQYRTSARHARGADLERLLGALDLSPGMNALDIATGAGHVAVRLAELGLQVWAMDPTEAMLAEAQQLAAERAVSVQWEQGLAEALPHSAATFDRVVCRRAAHHFSDLPRALREAQRVLRAGGLLGVSDMTAPAPAIDALNHVERVRDPSHRQARTPDEWLSLLINAGFRLRWLEVTVEPMSPQEWLAPVTPDEAHGRAALDEIRAWSGPLADALCPGGTFLKYRLLVVGEKPA
jgi:ubiquinone/menaquinone biosynthesis C-methylase UbiE